MNNDGCESAYTCDGNHKGDEYLNLARLQLDTKKAIAHLIYLDRALSHAEELEQ